MIIILIVQNLLASERDSLSIYYKNYFKNQLALIDDDCDACSSSGSGGSMGFGSMLSNNFIGIRYFNQQYKSTDGLYTNSPWYDENYNTMQLWGIVPIIKNLQLIVQVPYQFHDRNTIAGNQKISGIGDITTLAMYRLFRTKNDSTAILNHTLKVGAGLKSPTGKYDQATIGSVNPSFQLGTGSWDYSFLTEYVLKRKKLGLNTMVNYVVKTENSKHYRFGNQLNYSTTLFYLVQTKDKLSVAPQLGVAGEVYEANYKYSQLVRYTEGDVFFGKLGFEIAKNKFSFGANTMVPINQNLASSRVEVKSRLSFNFNYSL